MAMAVKMRTEKTKTEKQRLLMSFIRFCPIGSVPGFDSFMGFLSQKKKTQIIKKSNFAQIEKEKEKQMVFGKRENEGESERKKKGLMDNGDR